MRDRIKKIKEIKGVVPKASSGLWIIMLSMLLVDGIFACFNTSFSVVHAFLLYHKVKLNAEMLHWLLNLIGLSSVAVAEINEHAAKRCQGILLGDVLHYYFPFPKAVLNWFHLCFFLMGNYACMKEPWIDAAAAVGLMGLLLCIAITLMISYLLTIPHSGKNIFVRRYLSIILQRNASKKRSGSDDAERGWDAQICVMDYSGYVGGLWAQMSYRPAPDCGKFSKKQSEEERLIHIADAWMKQQSLEKTKSDPDSHFLPFRTAFFSLFDIPASDLDAGERILFTKCLPNRGEKCDDLCYQGKAIRCRAIWENLLAQPSEYHRKCQLALDILSRAKQFSSECFAAFAGGLLLQTRIFHSESERNYIENIWAGIDFLRSLHYEEEEDGFAVRENQKELSEAWAELMLVTIAGLYWNCIFRLHSFRQMDEFRQAIHRSVCVCASSALRRELERNYQIYITYAYMLTLIVNGDIGRNLSVYQQMLCYDYVHQEIADILIG